MHTHRKQQNNIFTISAIFGALLALVLVYRYEQETKTPFVYAGAAQNVSGFAWSQTVGWISFNAKDCDADANGFVDNNVKCGGNNTTTVLPDYGVNVDVVTGNFSGFAWSNNIGFINLNPAADGATGCPATPCAVMALPSGDGTRIVNGWARACDVLTTSGTDCTGNTMKAASLLGGWDGWIKLTDASWTNPANYGYMGAPGTAYDANGHNGVYYDPVDSKFKGFAWGGTIMGWVDFAPIAGGGGVILPPLASPVINVVPNIQADFGNVAVNTPQTLNFTITNTGPVGSFLTGTITISGTDAGRFVCTANCVYTNLPPSIPWTLTVTFTPIAIVSYVASADFSGGGGATRPLLGNGIISVSGSGNAGGGLNFGNVVVGKTKDLVLTITNSGSSNLGSHNLTFPYPVYTCLSGCPFNLPPSSSANVTIRFLPTATTTYNGNASLTAYPSVTFPFSGAGVSGSFQFKER